MPKTSTPPSLFHSPSGPREQGDLSKMVGNVHHDLFSHPKYDTCGGASRGLSRRLGNEVSPEFVKSFFTLPATGKIELPPLPEKDDALISAVRERFQLLHVPFARQEQSEQFLKKTFEVPQTKHKMSPYELQILLFMVNEGKSLELYFEPSSKDPGFQKTSDEVGKVVLGGRHHLFSRNYTPQEAYASLLHETTHARDRFYGHPLGRNDALTILREFRANVYGNLGNIEAAMRETEILYSPIWNGLVRDCPGFTQLNAEQKYNYLSIIGLSEHDDGDTAAVVRAEKKKLGVAFPHMKKLLRDFGA